jgi:general secretion pathway protein B
MSFILDALKKSELERQRQSGPGLTAANSGPRSTRLPIWAVALGVLLGINLLVLTFVVTRKAVPPAHASRPGDAGIGADAGVGLAAAPPAAAPAQHFSPLDAAPVYAPEIPVEDGDAAASPQPPVSRAAASAAPAAPLRSVHHADPLLTDADSKAELEVLPSMSEISLSGAQALPELHLDVHVYATNPADRFVYINMRKYHEGGALQEGPAVERIRRDGVVLNYQGLRFILPRQP